MKVYIYKYRFLLSRHQVGKVAGGYKQSQESQIADRRQGDCIRRFIQPSIFTESLFEKMPTFVNSDWQVFSFFYFF